MRKALALVVILSSSHAQACHRFTYWYYKTPQRCDTRQVAYAAPVERASFEVIDPPKVELRDALATRVIPPNNIPVIPVIPWDEMQRLYGIEKLKEGQKP
jgi:hypothetical protein